MIGRCVPAGVLPEANTHYWGRLGIKLSMSNKIMTGYIESSSRLTRSAAKTLNSSSRKSWRRRSEARGYNRIVKIRA